MPSDDFLAERLSRQHIQENRIMNTNPLRVGVGDTVTVYFSHCMRSEDAGPHTVEVHEVRRRYAVLDSGEMEQPLLKAVINGEDRAFDASYVTGVVARSQCVQEPENIFRGGRWEQGVLVEGSCWTGTLLWLTSLAMSKLSCSVERALDMQCIAELYKKELAGCKAVYHFGNIYTVDRYRFTRWVRKNRNRLCMTVRQCIKIETRSYLQGQADMMADLRMFDEMFDRSGGRGSMSDEPQDYQYIGE